MGFPIGPRTQLWESSNIHTCLAPHRCPEGDQADRSLRLAGQHREGFQAFVLSHLWITRCFAVFVDAAGVGRHIFDADVGFTSREVIASPGFSCTIAETALSAWAEGRESRCAAGS